MHTKGIIGPLNSLLSLFLPLFQAIKKLVQNLSSAETVDSLKENCHELTTRLETEVLLSKEKLNRQIKSLRAEKERALQQVH